MNNFALPFVRREETYSEEERFIMLQKAFVGRRGSRKSVIGGVLVGVLLIGGATLGSGPTVAQGMTASASNQRVTLNFSNAPIQTVLRTLFKSTGKNFAIDPAVHGMVNVNLADVSFDTALRTLLAATNPPLASDVQNGIYHITRKIVTPPVITAARPARPTAPEKKEALNSYSIPVDSYDAGILASMLNPRASVQIIPPNYVNPGGTTGANGRGGNNGRNGNQRGNSRGGGRRYRG